MREYILEQEQFIARPVDEVFPFFAHAGNLDRITPAWLRFRIVTPLPIQMRPGAVLDYRLRYRGVPVRWQTEIEAWEPGVRFVDRALRSPYALWHHTHTFAAVDGGTRMCDIVRYALPFGPLGRIAHGVLVRRDVERIFAFRRAEIDRMFATEGDAVRT